MRAVQRRALRWFRKWAAKGYTATYQTSGHYKVTDPDGVYVATISGTPSNAKAPEYETGRLLQRHERARSTP